MTHHTFGGDRREPPRRPLMEAMLRGFRGACPGCGHGKVFSGYLKSAPACTHCGEEFHHHRADDLPAYLVIFIVGHIVVGGFMSAEAATDWSTGLHLAIWVPLTVVMSLALIRPVKGAVIGLQWALYMHGFGGEDDRGESHPEMRQ